MPAVWLLSYCKHFHDLLFVLQAMPEVCASGDKQRQSEVVGPGKTLAQQSQGQYYFQQLLFEQAEMLPVKIQEGDVEFLPDIQ